MPDEEIQKEEEKEKEKILTLEELKAELLPLKTERESILEQLQILQTRLTEIDEKIKEITNTALTHFS